MPAASLPSGVAAAVRESKLVRRALEAAREAHAGHTRDASGGMPFVEHPIDVAERLAQLGFGEETLAAALLHDVVEDGGLEVADVRRRFGERVAGLVGALSEREAIDSFEQRKAEHRRRVAAAGRDALAIYAADKLSSVRTLRAAYERQGEAVEEELKAPLDVKMGVWERDLELLRDRVADLPLVGELAGELDSLRKERATSPPPTARP